MEEEQFIIVKIGNESYAIKINDVKEVIPDTVITPVPDKEATFIYGTIQCRYGCVSIFDIYRLFDTRPFSDNKWIILLSFVEKLLAFSVENVECVVAVSCEKICDIPSILSGVNQIYMQKIIVLDNNLVPIIDTTRLFKKAGVIEKTKLISQ